MSELIYPDTNFYMDHFDGRVDKLRPLGEFAFQVLRRTLQCEFIIVISSLVLDELDYNSYGDRINRLIEDLKEKNKVILAESTEEDRKEAAKIGKERNTDFNDTLHAVTAKRMKADYLVTRNIKDFTELQDFIKVVYPENL